MISFASDYIAGAHPQVLQRMTAKPPNGAEEWGSEQRSGEAK